MKHKWPSYGMVLDDIAGLYRCQHCSFVELKPKGHSCPRFTSPWLSVKLFVAYEFYCKYLYLTF